MGKLASAAATAPENAFEGAKYAKELHAACKAVRLASKLCQVSGYGIALVLHTSPITVHMSVSSSHSHSDQCCMTLGLVANCKCAAGAVLLGEEGRPYAYNEAERWCLKAQLKVPLTIRHTILTHMHSSAGCFSWHSMSQFAMHDMFYVSMEFAYISHLDLYMISDAEDLLMPFAACSAATQRL